MKSFYEMMRILENDQGLPNVEPHANFPPNIERERQLRLNMTKRAEHENRVWHLMGDAMIKAGIKDGYGEYVDLYGKEVEMTVFTHENGPYSGIERVSGVIYPARWNSRRGERGEEDSPSGFQVNNKEFDPDSIAEIHYISEYESLSDIYSAASGDGGYDTFSHAMDIKHYR